VEFNHKSFLWGRRAAADLERVKRIAIPAAVIPIGQHLSRDLGELVERRTKFLAEYQDAAYASRYRDLVRKVEEVEKARTSSTKLTEAVARYYAKLLAYKDEYEVARLYADGDFRRKIEGMFEGDYRMVFHLAPPLLARKDPLTGEPRKMRFGPWAMGLFKVLSKLRFIRGTPLDIFGYSEERRTERALIREYEETVARLLAGLTPQNHALAVQIASIPEEIRGFGHIKARNLAPARKKWDELLAQYASGPTAERAAA